MIQLIATPSAVALLQEVRERLVAHTSCSTATLDLWALLDNAAVDLGVPARAHVLAGNALAVTLSECQHPACRLLAIDLAITEERRRRLDIDAWLATQPGRAEEPECLTGSWQRTHAVAID